MAAGRHGTVRLRAASERPVSEGHPWVFPNAIAAVTGEPVAGDVVRVEDAAGQFLGWGHFSPASRLPVRILDRRVEAAVGPDWWRRRIEEALARRRELLAEPAGGCRLIFSEADLLPGLVVDRYADRLVLQLHTPGAEAMRAVTEATLARLLTPAAVLDRSDPGQRAREGLPPPAGAAPACGPEPEITIREDGLEFGVRLLSGQKTGFYLDQRLNRRAVSPWARGRRVLDAFCYTGAFAVHAARAGAASVALLDSSAEALAAAEAHLEGNGCGAVPREAIRANAFEALRRLRDARRTFDLIVLDPPRLAPTRAQADRAARAYKDANLLACKLLAPEGILATFSCSGGIGPEFFREILRWAALDAGREVQILQVLGQPPDHPVRVGFPESEYLTGLLCRVL